MKHRIIAIALTAVIGASVLPLAGCDTMSEIKEQGDAFISAGKKNAEESGILKKQGTEDKKKAGNTVEATGGIDLFAHLDEMNAFYTRNFNEGSGVFEIDKKMLEDFEDGGYRFEVTGSNTSSMYTVYKGEEEIGSIYFDYENDDNLKTGDTAVVGVSDTIYRSREVDKEQATFSFKDNEEFVISPAYKEYTVTVPKPLTAEEAKSNIDKMDDSLRYALATDGFTQNGETLTIQAIDLYYAKEIDLEDIFTDKNQLVIYYKTNEDNYFHFFRMVDAYLSGDIIRFNSFNFDGYSDKCETLADARSHNDNKSEENYTYTVIK